MKAMSIYQPWATLVVIGAKKFETRSWSTKYRGPLLIHATKDFPRDRQRIGNEPIFYHATNKMSKFWHVGGYAPGGNIIGRVELVGCYKTEFIRDRIDETERTFGDYGDNRWAWCFVMPQEFESLIEAKGAQRIWEFN